MDLSETSLKRLKYDKTKIVVSFAPVVKSGRITFRMAESVNRNYAFFDGGAFIVPCFKAKTEVARTVFADVYVYEQVRVPGDYGTYGIVPKRIPKEALNRFASVPGSSPAFEGYFDSLYAANRSYSEFLVPVMVNRILPFERISDPELVAEMKEKDFTEYGFDGFGEDGDEGEEEDDL